MAKHFHSEFEENLYYLISEDDLNIMQSTVGERVRGKLELGANWRW
jgi:hypothetical protein